MGRSLWKEIGFISFGHKGLRGGKGGASLEKICDFVSLLASNARLPGRGFQRKGTAKEKDSGGLKANSVGREVGGHL